MTEVDFEKLVKLAENPDVSKTAGSIEGILKHMGDIEKIVKTTDSFLQLIERSPTISALVRIVAKENSVSLDPLRKDAEHVEQKVQYVEVGLKPASDYHAALFAKLNSIPQEELQKQAQEAAKKSYNETPKLSKEGIFENGKPENK